MSKYAIRRKNVKILDVSSVEYHGDWMSSRYVNATIKYSNDIDFEIGDYLMYRGERFELKNAVSVKKQANAGTYGEAFVYSGLKFESLVDELVATQCLNYTLSNGSDISGNLLSTFSVHCMNVNDLVNLIKANLKRAKQQGIITEDWTFSVALGAEGKTDVTVDVSNINCLEALKMVYDEFGLGYQISKTARTITIGSVDKINNVFSFGRGKGLRDIERQLDNDYPLITRLRVVGSDKNMPRHYYYLLSANTLEFNTANRVAVFDDDPQRFWFNLAVGITLSGGTSVFVESLNESCMAFPAKVKIDADSGAYYHDVTIMFSMNGRINGQSENLHWSFVETNSTMSAALAFQLIDKTSFTLRVAKSYATIYPDKYLLGGTGNPSLLSLGKLIPTKYYAYNKSTKKVEEKTTYGSNGSNFVLDPYFDSENIALYGVREAFVEFNSDDDENGIEEVYPTIANGNNKVTVGSKNADGSAITDDGIFSSDAKIPEFRVNIDNIGFNLKNTQKDGVSHYGTLCMTSGMCGGREFEITGVAYNSVNNTQRLTLKRVEDESTDTWFPNVNFAIAKDDTFVITDIEMPDELVEAAGAVLATKAKAYLAKYDHPHYTYSVTVDNIYMARNYDDRGSDSIYWNIKEGDQIRISDTELTGGVAENICIDKLTIKEADGKIPQISITLRNEKKENTILKISRAVNAANVNATNAINKVSRNSISATYVKEIANSVVNETSGRIIINGDNNNVPTTDNAFISSIITKLNDANITSIADLVGAVYITANKKFYMLTYSNGSYSWTEDTDATLSAIYDKVVQASNDYCIIESEATSIEQTYYDLQSKYTHALLSSEVYSDNATIENAQTNMTNYWSALDNKFKEILNHIPCYFKDATNKQSDVYSLSFNKQDFFDAIVDFNEVLETLNDAVINYTANNIGDAAAQQALETAKEYVEDKIDNILDSATKETVDGWIKQYTDNKFVTKYNFDETKAGFSQYTTWIDENFPEKIGGTGVWTKLDNLFAGTNTITFDANGNVQNISKSGLVTSTDFAAIQSTFEDADGNITTASIAACVENGVSKASIFADHVYIESGKPSLGNYFSLSEGRLKCVSVTIDGYIQTTFKNITDSDAEWLETNTWLVKGDLHLVIGGNNIVLPIAKSYVGAHIIIHMASYPPYSRSISYASLKCQSNRVIYGTNKRGDGVAIYEIPNFASALYFIGGYIELVAVPYNDTECRWMLINHRCIDISGYTSDGKTTNLGY